MDHQGMIIRPPSEAGSVLLQVTLGCSHGRCAFCGAYLEKRFAIKPRETVLADILYAARHLRGQRRVFLCDGDAMILPQARLTDILSLIREHLPWVTRVGTYANAKSLKRKSDAELAELRGLGLGIVYMGLESGDDAVLDEMGKNGDADFIVEQGRRARAAGFKLNVTVVNGLGGVERSREHAEATARALTRMDPDQVGALSLMLVPGTPLHDRFERGEFAIPDARGILLELRRMLAGTELTRGLFLADHASNYLPLKVRLPSGKQAALDRIDQALAGAARLRDESVRRL
ncbi:coproporphyrinogen III oxidase [Pseudodesulfovibrio hydrargyri]|uniref:Coproporphyrinogen III oxidase n=1 Tax=Pseudodesulfovibrio hydrargyri TaxID=2125990 RepID=A0A1J5MV92_9BACT|nr:radical SAM protein [Pseudodesulfovibrio hydrargyri]OIQ49740.1 coproporphyrinogen III oxidase [Pseudodesulfovibrio hydrargyri]